MPSIKILKTDPQNPREEYIKEAAQVIAAGGLAIIPTDTVYGIAVNMADEKAVNRLYEIKQRPKNKPFSLLVDKKEAIEEFACDIPVSAYKLLDKFWPGALTLILKSKTGTVGLRMPDNQIALKIISLCSIPIACPSANLSGKPAPVNFEEAIGDLNGLVDIAIDAGHVKLGIESSIVDLTQEPLRILREAAIKREGIEQAAMMKNVLFVCTGNTCRSVMAEALLNKILKEKQRQDVKVLSAGLMAIEGMSATEAVKDVLYRESIDVSGHRSRRVTKEMLKASDIILVMDRLHEDKIVGIAPEVKNRVFLLKEFAKIGNSDFDILDPIGRAAEFYEETFRIIKAAIERVAEII